MPRTTFVCPQCNRSLGVPEELLGRWIKCPHCGSEFAAVTEDSSQADLDSPPGNQGAPWVIAACAVVGLIGLVGVVLIMMASGDRSSAASVPRVATQSAAAFGGLVFTLFLIGLALAYVVAVILILAWVAKDARSRGMDGAAMWVLVIFFTHWIGLLVYLASRPHGILVVCRHCNNQRLNFAKRCPHCGRA